MAGKKNSKLNISRLTKKLFASIRRRENAVVVLTLIQKGADVDARNSKGYTPLLLSSKYGLKNVVNLLIDFGAIVDNSECPYKRTLLHYASGYGWTDIVQSLVKRVAFLPSMVNRDCSVPCAESNFPIIHAKDVEGRTALHLASLGGHLEVVKCLLEKGADVAIRSESGRTALHEASREGYLEVVKFLLEKGANLEARTKYGKSALHAASNGGHIEVVKYLVEKGADVDAKNELGETPLLKASSGEHLDVVKYLLDKGADTEVKSFNGFTPLLVAAKCYFLDIVVLLINSGANVDCCDGHERTVLHYASRVGWISVVQYLVKKVPFILDRDSIVSCDESTCPTIHVKDMESRTALHHASFHGHLEIVKFLVEGGADLNVKNTDGQTALFEASAWGHLEIVKYLVKEGADMNAKNTSGKTPLLIAARFCRKDVVNLLVNSGANLNDCDEDNLTVLHYASQNGWAQIVQSLLRKVSDIDAKDNDGETALFYACRTGGLQTVEYLLKAGARFDIRNNEGRLPIQGLIINRKIKFIKLFIETGAYLMPVHYYEIANNFLMRSLLQDVKFCCQAIINKFNTQDLPALYELHASVSLPRIENMIIARKSEVSQAIEQTVKREIQTNGHCNVLEVRPMALSLLSVRSVLEYYDTKKPALKNHLKRMAASDSMNEYQQLSKSMRLS